MAIVEQGCTIGKNVTIEPYAIVKAKVILEDDVTIKSHAYLDGYTTIGKGTVVYPSAVIGTKTQDKKFKGEKTYVKIGKYCEIREFVTINSSCNEGSVVEIGDHCLIMACCHVAHNCKIGNYVTMANSALLAGHVTIEDYAIIGGLAAIHQHCRIGAYAMVGGFSGLDRDVPPFLIGGRGPFKVSGLNRVGLKRHNFSFEARQSLMQAFKLVYRSNLSVTEALDEIEKTVEQTPEVIRFVTFCRHSKRGLAGLDFNGESADISTNIEEIPQQRVSSQ
jgi:UDP-N-acetylglucosamine acyltransferase